MWGAIITRIIFHDQFKQADYANDAAAMPGRMENIINTLTEEGKFHVLSPEPASYEDLLLAHSSAYIDGVAKSPKLYEMALLAVGGAISASEISLGNEPAFACIRPPGHHASKNSSWGYCVFSNMGISLLKLMKSKTINSAFVLDFDAHMGDGTLDVLSKYKEVTVLNPIAHNNKDYLKLIETYINAIDHVDIVGVCAGFDSYIKDMGGKLNTFDFYLMGVLMKKFTQRMGHQRRFAILEGGYYLPDIGKNVLAFCQGFE